MADVAPWQVPQQPHNGVAPQTSVADTVADPTDISVAGRAPWDKPESFSFDEQGAVDDRPAHMLETFDEMIPRVTRAVAAAGVQLATSDPDDAHAPVLHDVAQPPRPSWPEWTAGPDQPVARTPVTPPAFAGKVVGPTPPEDLFGTPQTIERPQPVAAQDAAAGGRTAQPQPPAADQQAPHLFSTAANNSQQQPLVLRIELAIVDGSRKLRLADAARRVGPWSDEDVDPETVTPRHPEFEPRSHVAPPPLDEPAQAQPEPMTPDASIVAPNSPSAPWISASVEPAADTDLPWALPPLEPLAPAQPANDVVPWMREPVQPALAVQPAPAPPPTPALQPAAPASVQWADPNPTAAWSLASAPLDPLSTLPAATFAAPPYMPPAYVPPAQVAPVYAPQAAPAYERSAPAQSVAQPMGQQVAPVSRPAANADQSDLWFLASEPSAEAAEEAVAEKSGQPSTLLTAGLTVAMAVMVIILVLVFLQLMTSLLH